MFRGLCLEPYVVALEREAGGWGPTEAAPKGSLGAGKGQDASASSSGHPAAASEGPLGPALGGGGPAAGGGQGESGWTVGRSHTDGNLGACVHIRVCHEVSVPAGSSQASGGPGQVQRHQGSLR